VPREAGKIRIETKQDLAKFGARFQHLGSMLMDPDT
jgi:hypothetical protein